MVDGMEPLRSILRTAIVENFALDAGEVVLGDPVWMGAWFYHRKDLLRLIDNLDEKAFPISELKRVAREWPNR
ncbi:hypothetical protein JET14_17230 [Martelella lutilitoris]|uniref:Uncharacterized protein n=1 Tax=Martelella lutilitoris TaxID=2583532 RepID=A0A7T7HIX8_9HYPH|nr:hypothetical protein [Martelella lutilitoris]QQM30011.1 hypothetical protein JET14_17230 [Martelella lutilitoris]